MSAIFPVGDDPRWRQHTASAGQTVFPITYPFQDDADILIRKIGADGTVTTLASPADYTISGAGNPAGGSYTLTSPAAAGDIYRSIGDAVMTRTQSIVRSGRYSSKASDDDFDRSLIRDQELRRDMARAFKVDFGQEGKSVEILPEGHFHMADAAGNMVNGGSADDIAGAQAYAEIAMASAAAAQAAGGRPEFSNQALAQLWHPDAPPEFIDLAGRDYAGDGRGGRWKYHGTAAPTHKRWFKMMLADGVTEIYYVSTRPVYVILATGQSNMGLGGAVAGYTKPNNVYRWNLNSPDVNPLGDAFIDGGGAYAEVGLSYGGWHGADHLDADVYVINVARYSYPIAQWLPNPPTGLDMYAIVKANVEAALAQIGVSKIDEMLWWQGEGDWNSLTYVTDWITLYARFLNETWFGWSLPVTLFGISTFGTPSLGDTFNKNLLQIVARYPNALRYSHTATGFSADWDPADDYVHLLVSSIPEKTRLAYRAKPYSGSWFDPYYNVEIAGSFLAGRRSPGAADIGAGVFVSGAGVVSSYGAGMDTNFHLAAYNDADVSPTLVGSLYSSGTKLAFSVSGTFAIEAGTFAITTAFTVITNDPVVAADDAAAATAGIVLGAIYEDATTGCLRRRKA